MRNSGKTYRKALKSVASASNGKHIIFVSDTRPHANVALHMIRHFVEIVKPVLHHKTRVDFLGENGGSIEVITESEYQHKNKNGSLRGSVYEVIFDS